MRFLIIISFLATIPWTSFAQGSLDLASPAKIDEAFARWASGGYSKAPGEIEKMISVRHAFCAADHASCNSNVKWMKGACGTKPDGKEGAIERISSWTRSIVGPLSQAEFEKLVDEFFATCPLGMPGASNLLSELMEASSGRGWPQVNASIVDKIIDSGRKSPASALVAAHELLERFDAFKSPEAKPNQNFRKLLWEVMASPDIKPALLFKAAHYSFYRYLDVKKVFDALEAKMGTVKKANPNDKAQLIKLYCHAARFLIQPGLCKTRGKLWDAGVSAVEVDALREGPAAEIMAIGDATNRDPIIQALGLSSRGCVEPFEWRMFYLQQHYRAVGDIAKASECLTGLRKLQRGSQALTILFDQENMRNLLMSGDLAGAKKLRDELLIRARTAFGEDSLTETMLELDALKVSAIDNDAAGFNAFKKRIETALSGGRLLPVWSRQILEIEDRLLKGVDSPADETYKKLAKSETFMEIRHLQTKYKSKSK